MAPVKISNLVADYGTRSLIRNLSFIINSPAFIAIVGHNGSGKTTFFKAITQQIPYQGDIFINDIKLNKDRNPAAEGLIAVLAQKNMVGFAIPVKELVVMGRFRLKRFFQPYSNADYESTERILQQLQMEHLGNRNFQELSGGEQQMVWLAQMMVQDAQLCLLDEPTQQLDLYNKKKVFDLMTSWVQELKKTVLCITHDLHYLFNREGFLLNLSMPDPRLEPIDKTSIQKHIDYLENRKAK